MVDYLFLNFRTSIYNLPTNGGENSVKLDFDFPHVSFTYLNIKSI